MPRPSIAPTAIVLAAAATLTLVACDPVTSGDGEGHDGWYLLLGGEAPDEGGYPIHPHCLYRVPLAPGPDANAVYCPDEARWIQEALPPRLDHPRVLLIVEVDAHSGIYGAEYPIYEPWVQELHLIDVDSGADTVLGHYLVDSYEGEEPTGSVSRAFTLDDGRVAVHWTLPEAHGGRGEEVVVLEADGTLATPDLAAGLENKGLVGVLTSGDLLIRAADDEGLLRLLAVDPDGTNTRGFPLPEGAPVAAEFETRYLTVDPAGERVLLEIGGVPTITSPDGFVQLDRALEWGEHLMGWAGDGGALIEHDSIAHWDGTDGGSTTEIGLVDGAEDFSWDCSTHPDGAAVFQAHDDSGSNLDTWLTWYQGGELVQCELGAWSLSDPRFASDADGPVAIAHDSDHESPTRNQVFACWPDGTAEEVLSVHGLRGQVLPTSRIW